MKRTWDWRVEASVVFVLLAALSWIMLPSFFKAQGMRKVKKIQDDLFLVVDAMNRYRERNGDFPYEVYWPMGSGLSSVVYGDMWSNTLSIHPHTEQDLTFRLKPFIESGFLYSVPNSIKEHYLAEAKFNSTIVYHLYNETLSPKQTFNWGIAMRWPNASPEAVEAFDDAMEKTGQFQVNPQCYTRTSRTFITFDAAAIHPHVVFHPTNGLKSDGYVYVDLMGNKRP